MHIYVWLGNKYSSDEYKTFKNLKVYKWDTILNEFWVMEI